MPKPVIDGVGPNLSKNGPSDFWIYGENLSKDDIVHIVSQTTGATWTGKLKNPKAGGVPGKLKAKVQLDPPAMSGKKHVVDEDFSVITVTVTNQAMPPQMSDEKEDEAVIDA